MICDYKCLLCYYRFVCNSVEDETFEYEKALCKVGGFRMNQNLSLNRGRLLKNDEFYTMYDDISQEVTKYNLQNLTIYCNCDTEYSNFTKFFIDNFSKLKLKKFIATGLGQDYAIIYDGNNIIKKSLKNSYGLLGNIREIGDFRSNECIEFIKESDVIITNPPFSLFREFLELSFKYNKKILVLGTISAICYKVLFPLIQSETVKLGYTNKSFKFKSHDGEIKQFGNIVWYTNLPKISNPKLELTHEFSPEKYQKYDKFDAINVDKTSEIPYNYEGIMGVPISYLSKHCNEQFEIVGLFNHGTDSDWDLCLPTINGKKKFKRLAIRRKG